VLLRKAQYALSDSPERSLAIAKNIVAAKISNARGLLQRHVRNHGAATDCENVENAVRKMAAVLERVKTATDSDELRGYEGECASLYFGCFNSLITAQKDVFCFNGRSKRPPLDNVNALLSFMYAILANDIRSALETTGLDPQVGFFHRLRPGRPSLALDIMEEFRMYMADRIVLNLINLKQVAAGDFEKRETGEIRLSDRARKEVITAYQKNKDEVIVHPLLDEKTTKGLLFHVQSMLLARHVRGQAADYPPFYMK